jgi:antitoxin CcdA
MRMDTRFLPTSSLFDRSAPKKATNLSINSDLLQKTRALGINLSGVLEETLAELLARRQQELWLAENREGIEAYNEHVERHGVWNKGLRSF